MALKTKLVPRIWKRCVDDTLCVIEGVHERSFLDHLSSLLLTIQFTTELDEDISLLFLGMHAPDTMGGWKY